MMEFGTICWYGGKTREGRQNKFGFLKDLQEQEFHIRERALKGALQRPTLAEGLAVLFEKDDKGIVQQVVALDEAAPVQLFEAYKQSYHTTKSNSLLYRLLATDMRDVTVAFILDKKRANESFAPFVLNQLTEQEAILYLQCTESFTSDELDYIAQQVTTYDAVLDEKIAAAVHSGESLQYEYKLESVRHYPSFQQGIELHRLDWKELVDDPHWHDYILEQATIFFDQKIDDVYSSLFTTLPGHGTWDCFTPTQWLTNDKATALLKKNNYEYKRICLLKAQEDMEQGGITPQIIEQVVSCFQTIQEGDEKYVPIAGLQKYGVKGMLTTFLPDALLMHPAIVPLVSSKVLQERLNALVDKQDVLSTYLSLFEGLQEQEKYIFVEGLPVKYKREEHVFFSYLTAKEQVQYGFSRFKKQPEATWTLLSDEAKTLFVYFIAQQVLEEPQLRSTYCAIFRKIGSLEQNRQLKGILLILDALLMNEQRPNMKQKYFNGMRDYIEEDILAQLKANEPLNMIPILPTCKNTIPFCQIAYCEGRYYEPITGGAYCPRARKKCTFMKTPYLSGARLTGNVERAFEHWSLHELLAAANIEPDMPELLHDRMRDTYPNKLAGWVNRIDELRERLKCSHCNEPFRVDWGQSSRFHAVYNSTVYMCDHQQKPGQHDGKTYISHCRCCHLIIDSRESKFKINPGGTHYICIHCGGAEERDDYRPGDICPACGTYKKMSKMYDEGNWYECTECDHEIKTSR